MMNDVTDSQAQQINLQQTTRRHFFSQCSMGLGSVALGSLLGDGLAKAAEAKPNSRAVPSTWRDVSFIIGVCQADNDSPYSPIVS